MPATRPPAAASAERPEVVAADALVGDPVVNRAGEVLGTLDDLVLDTRRAGVAYAVVARAGPRGEQLVPVPWSLLEMDGEARRFVLDAQPARFALAPAFERERWPAAADWTARAEAFFSGLEGTARALDV